MVYFLFFLSGISGLIYQVIWVRVFGNVFGNTIYSTSLVVAVFMLGLGIGSYVVGVWADRRYAGSSSTPHATGRPGRGMPLQRVVDFHLRAYAYFELAIASLGFGISIVLPHLTQLSAFLSRYVLDANGWYVLSTTSYIARTLLAIVLLVPITLLMGGTLTLLIRHLVRREPDVSGWRIAVLYGVNTAGAALGCFLTDFTLVPALGLRNTQFIAVFFNAAAAAGALWILRSVRDHVPARKVRLPASASTQRSEATARPSRSAHETREGWKPDTTTDAQKVRLKPETTTLVFTSLALALSGFAAMGMEILWFRHFSILLGGFRAVFSLLLTVILIGIGIGSLASSFIHRSASSSADQTAPAQWLMAIQGVFVAAVLIGLSLPDPRRIDATAMAGARYQPGAEAIPTLTAGTGAVSMLAELWFNAKPILLEVALPALLMGFSFPLANAIIQHAEHAVGRRAGLLYLANTIGAVCGSVAVGFLLLPWFGIQASATTLTATAALAIVPLYVATTFVRRQAPDFATSYVEARRSLWRRRQDERELIVRGEPFDVRPELGRRPNAQDRPVEPRTKGLRPSATWKLWQYRPSTAMGTFVGSVVIAGVSLVIWLSLPADYLISRALGSSLSMPHERLLTLREGLTEAVAVTEVPGQGRRLLTNGHPMSATTRLSQRYMRALAHVPLLAIEKPSAVLVIGFGVGNTTHAATLHPSVRRVEVADLSRDILAQAHYFGDVNKDVLKDSKVVVYLNDGRHHLQMQPPASYDLIALEPPPIAYAGVASLYSKEFYGLARSRLKAKGYISQWLPAYQVPTTTTLAMVRAFIDVFPQAVLLSGAEADLLLLGVNDSHIEFDPVEVTAALSSAPAVETDLRRLDLGSAREIVGMFIGSPEKLQAATRDSAAVTDDRPIQEYGVHSLLNLGEGVPGALVDLRQVSAWCPSCFTDGRPASIVEGLDTYLALVELGYKASPAEIRRARDLAQREGRTVDGSAYLGEIVPESADLHNVLGIGLAEKSRIEDAIREFEAALRLEPDSAMTHWNLGAALATRGARQEAIDHLRRSVQLDPANGQAQYDLANTLLDAHEFGEAIDHFRAALRLLPELPQAHNNLGIALVAQGQIDEAISQFQEALKLDPKSEDARRNLTEALRRRR